MSIKLPMKIQLLASDNDEKSIEELELEIQDLALKLNDITEKYGQLQELNTKLSERNQEYFLKITGNKEDKEEDINIYEEYVGKEFYDLLSTKEKNMLKTILEGED